MVDYELIDRCLKEDRRAQEAFYKICYTHLIKTAFRYSKDKEQTIYFFNIGFVRILLNLNQFKKEVNFEFWAKRVLINTILNELKKEKRERERIVLDEEEHKYRYATESQQLDPDMEDRLELIKEKSMLLPPMTKNVFNLYAIDGYKHHEIAELLGISENTSMWHFSEAKKRIKQLLEV